MREHPHYGKKNVLTGEQREFIRATVAKRRELDAQLRQLMTIDQLAKHYGVCRATIFNAAKD